MQSDFAVRISNLSKCYQVYAKPNDRLKQFVLPLLWRSLSPLKKLFPSSISASWFSEIAFYREFWALKNVSFEIRKGETVGIIGRNGSGKSTLLQMICGTLNPSDGSVQTNGRVAALLELGSGFNPEFTGRENVLLNASVLGLDNAQTLLRFDDIQKFADIGDFIDQPVKTYSSGMMLRLAFAVIAHVDADILIVDEALSVGDAFFTQKCMRFLREFMKTGTVLFVSHDTSAVINLCNRAVLLEKGKLSLVGTPKDVSEHYLATLYAADQSITGNENNEPDLISHASAVEIDYRDARDSLISNSTLRNEIEIFRFTPGEATSFGAGGASVDAVHLFNNQGEALSWVIGGSDVCLQIRCTAKKHLYQPIVGFQFKDKLGQIVFADNTHLAFESAALSVAPQRSLIVRFSFRLPVLPSGDYCVDIAIAEGTQHNHTQLEWVYDALAIRVHASSICFGLIGVPMKSITMDTL